MGQFANDVDSLTALAKVTTNNNNSNIAIGDIVNYSTSLNDVTLDDWKVFYVDGDYTYIILADYLFAKCGN